MDQVECPKCQKSAIPKLWHYRPFLGRFRYAKTQHLCPFCGCCMYETGGQITWFGRIVLVFFVLPLLMIAAQGYLQSVGTIGTHLAALLPLAVLAAVVFWFGRPLYFNIRDFVAKRRA